MSEHFWLYSVHFELIPWAEEAFSYLERYFTLAPILKMPDEEWQLTVEVDACYEVGAVLSLRGEDNKVHPSSSPWRSGATA